LVHTEIEELLAERLGFDIETIGSGAVANMVSRAMQQAGFSDAAAYAWVLRRDPDVWEHLVDHVVVPETWFFRDVAPFELVANLVRAHIRTSSHRMFRILSCPCSTGEEPYSLVMSILQASARPDSFVVDAVDVSRRSLEVARQAVFNPRSFRGNFPWDHEPHFDTAESEGAKRLNAASKACVRFRQGNIIAPDFLKDEAPYDVVFCRNLLIYLRLEARLIAMAALRRLVADNGVLVLGHAETVFAREHGFKPTGPPGAFAFVKSNDRPTNERNPTERKRPLIAASKAAVRLPIVPVPATPIPAALPIPDSDAVAPQLKKPPSLLTGARELADAGQLHLALEVCGEHLQLCPDSAEGYFLLGVLHDALGHVDLAASSFRKVLYLEPNHHDALLCLALKREARGDSAGAALLRARARRVQGNLEEHIRK
jgi:chemotaxis protein methyltransferase WspC